MKSCGQCGQSFEDVYTRCRCGGPLVPASSPPGALPARAATAGTPNVKKSQVPETNESRPKQVAAAPAGRHSNASPAGRGCPKCGGKLKYLESHWPQLAVTLAAAFVYEGGLTAVFVLGIGLGAFALLQAVTCATCGKIPMNELSPTVRARFYVKKFFVIGILFIILFSAYVCFQGMKELGSPAPKQR